MTRSPRRATATKLKRTTPKRPTNAFILFRSNLSRTLANTPERNQQSLSVTAKLMWEALGSTGQQPWYARAEQAKHQHMVDYPGYRYSPRSNAEMKLVNAEKNRKRIDREVRKAAKGRERVAREERKINGLAGMSKLKVETMGPLGQAESYGRVSASAAVSPIVLPVSYCGQRNTLSTPYTVVQLPESTFDEILQELLLGTTHCSLPPTTDPSRQSTPFIQNDDSDLHGVALEQWPLTCELDDYQRQISNPSGSTASASTSGHNSCLFNVLPVYPEPEEHHPFQQYDIYAYAEVGSSVTRNANDAPGSLYLNSFENYSPWIDTGNLDYSLHARAFWGNNSDNF